MELFCLDKQKTTRQKIEHFKMKTSLSPIGTLSKDDDNGSENVGKKNEFAFFQSKLRLWTRSICQNAGDFS